MMLEKIRALSVRAKIAIIIGFLCSIFSCAIIIEDKLSLMGCKSSMTLMEYVGAGSLGLGALIVSFMVVGLVLFGVLSIPQTIKNYLNKINKPTEMEHLKYAMKENVVFVAKLSGSLLALLGAILTLGAVLGYVGWLLFC